jgi:hypothetical protein
VTKTLTVLPAQISVRQNGLVTSQILLPLPDSLEIYQKADANGLMQALPGGYAPLSVDVINTLTRQSLSATLQVRSSKGLFQIGTFTNRIVPKLVNGQERNLIQKVFVPLESIDLTNQP